MKTVKIKYEIVKHIVLITIEADNLDSITIK